MIKFDDVTIRRGPRVLFAGADFSIYRGEKAGITGENGSGKSSLMAMVPDSSFGFEGTVVCGCGGGQAIRPHLPAVLSRSAKLVLDADALNTIAQDSGLQTLLVRRASAGLPTVLTPHPLEAARLLGCTLAQVQSDRCAAAQSLAQRWSCVVVLKGAGTVVAAWSTPLAISTTRYTPSCAAMRYAESVFCLGGGLLVVISESLHIYYWFTKLHRPGKHRPML
jgi:hypothetical protein